jgi:hypothetical protein
MMDVAILKVMSISLIATSIGFLLVSVGFVVSTMIRRNGRD